MSDFNENDYRAALTREIAQVYTLLSNFLEHPIPSKEDCKEIIDYLNSRSKTLNFKLYKLNGGTNG